MNSAAAEVLPALDRAEDELQVTITVLSFKHDCHTAYMLTQHEIDNGLVEEIIRDLKYRLQDFIQEKLNAAREGKESKDAQRLQ